MTNKQNLSIDVQIDPEASAVVGELDTEPLRLAALATLVYEEVEEKISSQCELTVVISDDKALQDLNRRFRGEDYPTDVLSFGNDTRGPYAGGMGAFPHYLGDIVISIEQARTQAEAVGGTLEQELQLLIVHGVLHLLGYEHDDPRDKALMWEHQSTILKALGANIPLPE